MMALTVLEEEPMMVSRQPRLGDCARWSSAGLICALLCASPTFAAEDWKFDVVHVRNGHQFEGLILEESKEALVFRYLLRKPGERTVVIDTTFAKDEIKRIDRLQDDERKELAERVALLDRGGEKEKTRIKQVRLQSVAWSADEQGRQYECKYFTLVSNAHEDVVRLVAVRLEDMFQAYVDRFGARREPAKPTQIILCKSAAEYHQRLSGVGLNILNPAYYDPRKNQILAAADLEQRSDEYEKLRQKHDGILKELDAQEKKVRRHFSGDQKAMQAMLEQIWQTRRGIQLLNAENASTFERLKRPLFTILSHEAFHAYLESFVYPMSEGGVPHWLNEGLAQIFETAVVDGGELKVGRVDLRRLTAMKDEIRQKQTLKLNDVLTAAPRQFQLAHYTDRVPTDQLFVTSWALAYYLTFDRKLLGSESMDRWLANLKRGARPDAAFQELVGQPLDEFEKQWRQYVLNLQSDGSVKK
jgi:hypothetical protein